MGSDFNYEAAADWFTNIDKIIKHVNADGRVNAFYSSPDQYVAAKRRDAGVTWPLKEDDFFPYADGPHKFWTGCFTSRPALKRYIRTSSSLMNAVWQMQVFGSTDGLSMSKFEEAVGVAQHHDAVAGTAKQHVAFDYAKRLTIGEAQAEDVMSASLNSMYKTPASQDWAHCRLLNQSDCPSTAHIEHPVQNLCGP